MFPTIKALLLASPSLVALVAERIYPDNVPQQESAPALSLFLVSTVYDDLPDGTRLITASNWQINCIANSRMDASTVADAVFHALHGKQHDLIKFARITNRSDDLPDTGVSLRRTIIDVELKHFT